LAGAVLASGVVALGPNRQPPGIHGPLDPALAVSLEAPSLLTPSWLAALLGGLLLLSLLGYLAWTLPPEHSAIWRAVPFAVAAAVGGQALQLAVAARLTLWLDGALLAPLTASLAFGLWAALGAFLTDRMPLERLPVAGTGTGLLLALWAGLERLGLLLPAPPLAALPPAGQLVLLALVLALPGLSLGMPLALLLRAAGRNYAQRPLALLLAIHGGALALGASGAVALGLGVAIDANLLLAAGLFGLVTLLAQPVLTR
jgi:hypothetical protein